jgi:hypothetical protein
VIVGPDKKTAYVSNYGEGTLHTLAVVDLPSPKTTTPDRPDAIARPARPDPPQPNPLVHRRRIESPGNP